MVKLNKEVVKGSIILLIGVNIFSALGFLFQISMARLLTLAEYGVLATLFSILYFLGFFTESIQTLVAHYSSREKNTGKVKYFLKQALKKSFVLSLGVFIIYLIVAIPLSSVLEISYGLVAFTGLFIFASLLVPTTRGVMQGKKFFKALSLSVTLEGVVKLVGGVALVYVGFNIYGAVGGAMLGTFLAFALSFIPLKGILSVEEKKASAGSLKLAAKPTFLIILAIMVFYSIDIVIAKTVFEPEVAGAYAIASVIAKAIFWGTHPISKVMFPLSSENKTKKTPSVFVNAFVLLVAAISAALIIFYLFPSLLVNLFSGKEVVDAIAVLFYVGLAMGLISIANLVLLYKLSIGKTHNYILLLLCVAVEAALLFYFSGNLVEFSLAFVTASGILLWVATITGK